jgi:myo-inositol-1(or 4)-monophosphatase
MNLKEICYQVIDIVKDTAELILTEGEKRSDFNPETKGRHDYVTHVDKMAESKLVEELGGLIPESGFIAEEGSSNKKGDIYNWVIDPIDGTTNFIHGLPPYAISVALMEKDELVAGVVYELGLKECFYAWKGSPAYLNGKEIKVSSVEKVNDALIATGFPYTNYKYLPEFLESLQYFMENSHGLRRLGSAATDIVYIACGRFDAFYEYGLNPWDVAAAVLILNQAGGLSSDFSGGSDYLFGQEIISSNGKLHSEFQEIIFKIMK